LSPSDVPTRETLAVFHAAKEGYFFFGAGGVGFGARGTRLLGAGGVFGVF
jgi:hypothetical protein